MVRRTALTIAAALVVAVPAQAQQARLSNAEIAGRVQAVVERIVARPEAVGLSVAVAVGDEIIVDAGFGKADLEWNLPADETAIFRIGSVTKQFTGAAIMRLAETGKLSLDDPLSKYVPEFDTGGRTVTIRQLLNHTSGVPSYTSQPEFMSKYAPRELSDEELLATVAGVDFDFEPGEKWNYSNTGYYLLGMVAAKASGKPFGAFLRDEFFEPLGLSRTYYGADRAIVPHRAQGYQFHAGSRQFANDEPISMNVPGAAGAMWSTAGDLVRWQIALTEGRAVSPASYQEMITSTAPTGQGDGRYGFGLMLGGEGEELRISHGGGIPGFNSSLSYLPAKGLRTAVISNSDGIPADVVESQIIAALTSQSPPPVARTGPQPGAEQAVLKLIAGVARGEPDYSMMSDQLAGATRGQLPMLQQTFAGLGPIRSVTFSGVDLRGADIYRVELENGALDFSIMLGPEGKVVMANLRPVNTR
jgi:CubicO group peptidase (beta-lactamase class C family)